MWSRLRHSGTPASKDALCGERQCRSRDPGIHVPESWDLKQVQDDWSLRCGPGTRRRGHLRLKCEPALSRGPPHAKERLGPGRVAPRTPTRTRGRVWSEVGPLITPSQWGRDVRRAGHREGDRAAG